MTLTYQRFIAVLLLIYGSLFLSGIYYCLPVFWCAATRMSELPEKPKNIQFLVKLGKSGNEITKQITVLEHPVYSPDLAPSDIFLFPKIKERLKGRHFDDDDIRRNTTAALQAIPQNQFQNCFEGWTRRWHQCIAYQGEYFEGDHGGIQQWGM